MDEDQAPPLGEPAENAPLAAPDREEAARDVFAGWDSMSPEEWAARNAHTVLCSSFDRFRYRDAALQRWLYKLHAILADPEAVMACRRAFLPEQEAGSADRADF